MRIRIWSNRTFRSFFENKKSLMSHKTVEIRVFLLFCLMMKDTGDLKNIWIIRIRMGIWIRNTHCSFRCLPIDSAHFHRYKFFDIGLQFPIRITQKTNWNFSAEDYTVANILVQYCDCYTKQKPTSNGNNVFFPSPLPLTGGRPPPPPPRVGGALGV